MCTDRRRLLILGVLTACAVACSVNEDRSATTDGGALPDVVTAEDAAVVEVSDAAAPPVCKEGRRRCVGPDLELCDGAGWILLQSCLAGEWCDVAVGICRAVDAGPDSSTGDAS